MTEPELLVLASLAGEDRHGYEIMEDVTAFAGVRLGPGTLYGAITRLEEKDWIRPMAADGRRKPYRITPAGRRYLRERTRAMGTFVAAATARLEGK